MIGHQLTARAQRAPHSPALIFGERRYSYAALNERACRLANGLSALGASRGERIAVLLHNCTTVIETLFAAAKLGAVFVPFNFRLAGPEIAAQLEACTPTVLLAGHAFRATLGGLERHPAYPRHVLCVNDMPGASDSDEYAHWLAQQSTAEPRAIVSSDEVHMLLHSSGTTGLPKGAIYTHATSYASSVAKIIDFGLSERDTTVVFGPLFHAGPLMDLTLPLLLRGGRVVIGASRGFDPSRLIETIAAERGTVIPIYPTMLKRVVNEVAPTRMDTPTLRMIITGGEAVPVPVIRRVHECFPDVDFVNNYGSTEGGPVTAFLPAHESRSRTGSVGRESFSVEVRIAGDDGRPLPSGEIGEVLVRSPFVCRGYWNRPELTAASRHDAWWRTGDLAYRDDEGCLWITGRIKDLIKTGTEAVWPIEVEQAIASHPAIDEVAVIGVPDDLWGEAVTAYIVPAPGARIDAHTITAHCRTRIAAYKCPRHVRFIERLPRGPTNKVLKDVLRSAWAADQEGTR